MKPDTSRWLAAKGWSVERRYDIESNLSYLSQGGWVVFPEAVRFLQSFDGLGEFSGAALNDINFSINTFSIHSLDGFSWLEEAEAVEKHLNVRLYPIGYQDLCCLLIGSDDSIYAVDADITFYRLGIGISNSLDNLFHGRYLEDTLTTLG